MRALVQRVSRAAVLVKDGPCAGQRREIGPGLLVLLGVADTDDVALCPKLAEKCAHLRVFEDDDGKMNISAAEKGYSALVVSQFTLHASTQKGKRPSFIKAAKPPLSVDCYEAFVRQLGLQGLKEVKTGEFGAMMDVELVNAGPVTVLLDTEEWKTR